MSRGDKESIIIRVKCVLRLLKEQGIGTTGGKIDGRSTLVVEGYCNTLGLELFLSRSCFIFDNGFL